jgi:hypothetical protein
MYSPRLISTLNEIAHQHAPLIKKAIVDVLSQPRYTNTGAAVASVEVTVIEGDETKSPDINITFADHLIMLNKSKMQWTRLPNLEKLIEWTSTKTDTREKAEKFAFAIAWDKRKNDTWKSKTWRKKSLSQVLKDMNEDLLKKYDEAIDADLVDAVKGK